MIAILLACAQTVIGGESEPRAVRIEVGDERLSAVLAKITEETGVTLRVGGPWDPRLAPGVREGCLWAVLDGFAREAGGRLVGLPRPWHSGGDENFPEAVEILRSAVSSPVAYAGPFRVALRGASFRRARGENATPGEGTLTLDAWPEPGRWPLSFEWVVDRIELDGRRVEPSVEADEQGEFSVKFPAERPGDVRMAGRVRAVYFSEFASVRMPDSELRKRSRVQIGRWEVRIEPTFVDEEYWQGKFRLRGADADTRLGVVAPGVRGEIEEEEGPGVLDVDARWRQVAAEDRVLTIWCAEGTRTREWEARFEPIALPAEE